MAFNNSKRLRAASESEDEVTPRFDTFFVIESITKDKNFTNVSPFKIEKCVYSAIGTANSVEKLRDGKLLVEVNREKQSKNIAKLEFFCDLQVIVYPHKTLNSSKGIIRDRRLFCCSDTELIEELKPFGVTHVRRIRSKINGVLSDTNNYVLTFNTPKRPTELIYLRKLIPVRPYIPNPLRCYNCQKFGHHENNCKSSHPVCAKCASQTHPTCNCTSQDAKCANCGASHPSNSSNCPVWKKEKEVTKTKFTRNVSYREARKLVEGFTAANYSTVVKSALVTARKDAQTQTVDVSTQTETVTVGTPVIAAGGPKPAGTPLAKSGETATPAGVPNNTGLPVPKDGETTSTASDAGGSKPGKPLHKESKNKSGNKKKDSKVPPVKETRSAYVKTSNKFDVFREGLNDDDEMDFENNPSHGRQSLSPIRPPK